MKKALRKFVSILLVVAVTCSFITSSFAASSTRKCYTISASNTTVYSNTGLSTRYGTIYPTDELTVVTVTSRYCKVTYPVSGGTKTGYIPTSAILTGTSSSNTKIASAKITTYRRNSTSNTYGSISKGDTVAILGTKGSYTQVKYPVSSGYKYAFIKTSDANSYLGTSSGSSDSNLSYYQNNVGKVIANTSSYVTKLDGYTAIKGQCVWYVRNRGYEKLGSAGLTGIGGNANTWYSTAKSKGLSRGTTPKTNSIACWNGGSYGHVAFVEYYDSTNQVVYFTEGNWPNSTNGILKKMNLSSFKSHMSGYQGCIYLQ
jgi:surface antigen